MLDNLSLDHIAINVKENIDEAYKLFSELGFTLTPRGYHTLGSINHSMVFKNDYLELIGTPKGKPNMRPELKEAEIYRERFDMLGSLDEHIGRFISNEWVKKNILRFNDDDIETINKQIEDEERTGENDMPDLDDPRFG